MARAFWTIVPAAGTGTSANPFRPALPALPGVSVTAPGDINRLPAGPPPADHVHLIVGNVALLSDQPGGGHEHYVVNGNTALRGTAVAHAHPDPAGPDFFLCFVRCPDAAFAALTTAHNVKPLVEVAVGPDGSLGGLVTTPWDNASPNDWERKAFWDARALSLLGLALPPAVDRGARLWRLLAGMFLARRPASDEGLR